MPSVLRRYTPPTCTLEIAANESPLSRWTDRSVLKQLRFQLSFDDPRLLPEEQVQVTGDRTQLEALHEAVEAYVQKLLDSAPSQFNGQFVPSASEAIATADLSPESGVAHPELAIASNAPAPVLRLAQPPIASPTIYLTPKGLLNHQLHLGSLATPESGETVSLSTLQLFDLANALDEYAADAIALPALARPSWMQSRAGWLRVAAVAVVALGVTTTLGKFVLDVSSPEMQTASSPAPDQQTFGTSEGFSTTPPELDPANLPPDLTAIPTPIPGALTPGTTPPGATAPGLPTVPVPGTVPPSGSTTPTRPTNIPALPNLAPITPGQPQADDPEAIAAAPSTNPQGRVAEPRVTQIPPLPDSSENSADRAAVSSGIAQEEGAASAAPSSQAAAGARGTAFDTIPQVAEMRDYFQQRWTPPEALNQTLEYRLSVGADGTLQQITPLGQASSTYVDRTGIPLTGEPLVSPLESARSARIRLVLSPDGRVQTFLEATE